MGECCEIHKGYFVVTEIVFNISILWLIKPKKYKKQLAKLCLDTNNKI